MTRRSASNRASITVKAALEVPSLMSGAPEIVAGRSSIDRSVRWVHTGETPNIARLLVGGEMLLTSGLQLDTQPAKLRRFVNDLADREIAVIVLELGPRFTRAPAAMVEAADERGLPMVVLHQVVAFVSVTEEIHSEIVNGEFSRLRRGDEVQRRFSDLLLAGAGIAEIVTALAELVENPVVVEKSGRGLVFSASAGAEESQVLAAWRAPEDIDPHSLQPLVEPVRTGEATPWGRIHVFPLLRPLGQPDEVAVERAASIIALMVVQRHQADLLVMRGTGNMLRDLTEGRLDDTRAENAARALGFARRAESMLPVAVAPVGLRSSAPWRWADISTRVTDELAERSIAAIAGLSDDGETLLLIADLKGDRAELAGNIAATVRRHASDQGQVEVAISVAGESRSWTDAGTGLRVAIRGLGVAAGEPGSTWFDATLPNVEQLLQTINRQPEAREFVNARLGPLIEHDRMRNPKLLQTLESYFANGGSKTETARALHLERQSLYHRLARIEELLGESLDGEATLLGVQLALRLLRSGGVGTVSPTGEGPGGRGKSDTT